MSLEEQMIQKALKESQNENSPNDVDDYELQMILAQSAMDAFKPPEK